MAWGWPEGITHYFGILPLEGKFTIKRRTSEAWMLWRESATDVGKIGSRERLAVDARFPDRHAAMPTILAVYDTGSRIVSALGAEHAPSRRDRNAATSLWAQVNALSIRGSTFIDDLEDIADRMPGAELEVYVQGYRAAIRDLRNYEATGPIGDALCFYLDQHSLIMGDLHVGNFGVVEHTPREPVWAITDPGHVLSVA